jgi:hypothetical protein
MTAADHLLCQPSQILHERHAQVDRHRPELPDGERRDALVGPDEMLTLVSGRPS